MLLASYADLIRHLPYLDQAFQTSKGTWNAKKYSSNSAFTTFCDTVFEKEKYNISFSRGDLFIKTQADFNTAVFSIIFWGYPRNMRGNNFETILNNLPQLETALSISRNITENEFYELHSKLKQTGVGLSTLSKFLYFFGFKIDNYPCLILDSRIIEILKKELYDELKGLKNIREYNKIGLYKKYLQLMFDLSEKNNYSVDQLEFFLFMFGNNLKPGNYKV